MASVCRLLVLGSLQSLFRAITALCSKKLLCLNVALVLLLLACADAMKLFGEEGMSRWTLAGSQEAAIRNMFDAATQRMHSDGNKTEAAGRRPP